MKTLAFLIHSTPQAIEQTISTAREKRGARYFDPIQVATNLDMGTFARLVENRPRLDNAILLTDDLRRVYPQGDFAGHVLGFTQSADKEDLARSQKHGTTLQLNDRVGKSGLERFYDHELQGVRGEQLFEVDAQSRPVALRYRTAEKPGATVQLSLDAKLQHAAENALAAARNSGALAAIDPRTGEILALASRPGFDPNIFSLTGKQFQQAYLKIVRDPKHPMVNRAVTSRFPPGSTFKPFRRLRRVGKRRDFALLVGELPRLFHAGPQIWVLGDPRRRREFVNGARQVVRRVFLPARFETGQSRIERPDVFSQRGARFWLGPKNRH